MIERIATTAGEAAIGIVMTETVTVTAVEVIRIVMIADLPGMMISISTPTLVVQDKMASLLRPLVVEAILTSIRCRPRQRQ
jgi:hypothetical protein